MARTYFELKPKDKLGRSYRVVEILGSGWEGEVYKVEERRTGILRAVKIFYAKRKYTNVQLRRYTKKLYKLRKCSIITQYHHSDLVKIGTERFDMMVSDLADGEMLSTYLKRYYKKSLKSFEALHLLYALAEGVEQIHIRGEYHGDIHSNNVLVLRKGLGFKVKLLDFFDLGRPSKNRIQMDVYDMISLLHEMIGGVSGYTTAGDEIRQIILGRKHNLILKKYKTAGQLRIALENLSWDI